MKAKESGCKVMKKTEKSTILGVKLSESLKSRFSVYAEEKGLSLSALVRVAVSEYMENHSK